MTLSFQWVFKRLFWLFLLYFLGLFTIFYFLDAIAVSSFTKINLSWYSFLSEMALKAKIFLPSSFLLSLYTHMLLWKRNHELMALKILGFSKQKILLPIFSFALFLFFLSLVNIEWIQPSLHTQSSKHLKLKKARLTNPIKVKVLKDGSHLLMQKEGFQYTNVYWIRSHDEIWHMKTLVLESSTPIGYFVDILKRKSGTFFEKVHSEEMMHLPLSLDHAASPESFDINGARLSKLIHLIQNNYSSLSCDQRKLWTHLIFKTVNALLPFFIATIALTFLLTERIRNKEMLFIFLSMLSFSSFYSLQNIFIILSENYIISPWFTLLGLPLVLQTYFTWKLCKI